MTAFAATGSDNLPMRWPREMPAALGEDYADRFGEALAALGYAADDGWTAELPETPRGPDFPTSAKARETLAATEEDARRFLRGRGLIAVADKETPQHLRAYGFAPDLVIDVGVDGGTPFLYRAFPDTPFLLVDPRTESRDAVAAGDPPQRYDFAVTALGPAPGEAELRIPLTAKGEVGAMAGMRARTDSMATGQVELRRVPVVTLDSLTEDRPGRLGLKIDTEGFEFEVLQGAPETLRRCEFVILEMSVAQRFEGEARPSQITGLLAEAGLEFRDVLRTTGDGRGGPTPRLFDVLYTRWSA